MYFVPSVTCALQGHSHRLLAGALGLSIPETLLATAAEAVALFAMQKVWTADSRFGSDSDRPSTSAAVLVHGR
jgi:hypothetical protein